MITTMSLSGWKELDAAFSELKNNATSRRVAERALKKAATVIQERAVELAPDDAATGVGKYLRESIKIGRSSNASVQKQGNSGSSVTVFIGIDGTVLPSKPSTRRLTKKGTGKPGGGVASYSIFVEYGANGRAPHPYMRPAFEEKKTVAIVRMGDEVRAEIAKTVARAARKAAKS